MNSWIEVTGWTLAHFVWQGGLIALMVATTLRLGWRWSSNARYVVACAGLAAMLAVPAATALVLASPPPTPPRDAAVATLMLARRPQTDAVVEPLAPDRGAPETAWRHREDVSGGVPPGGPRPGWLPLVVWSWCAGVVLLSARMAARLGQVRRLLRAARRVAPPSMLARCEAIASRLGLRVSFRIVESAAVDCPTVVGWVRPVILLPIAALANLSPAQVDAILTHELAHIRRHDYIVNLLQSVVETLLFYHPAVWWLSGRVRAEREHACDDIALLACDDRVEYATALAELETWRTRDSAPALAATQGPLLARVRRILRGPAEESPRSPGWIVTLAAALTVTAVATGLVDLTSWRAGREDIAVSGVGPSRARAQEPGTVWETRTTDHFEIFFDDDLASRVDAVAAQAEVAYRFVSGELHHDLGTRVHLVVFETHSEFEQQNAQNARAARVGSFSDPSGQRIVLPLDESPDQVARLLTHELTHQFAFDIIPRGVVRQDIPLWVDEGLADYMAGVWRALDLMTVRDAALSDTLPEMSTFQGGGLFANPRLVYNLGHAAFEFIETRWGKDGVRRFLLSLGRTAVDGGDLYENAFGLTPEAFDDAFVSYIRDRFQAFRDKERPADYGRSLTPDPVETEYLAVYSIEPSPSGDLIAAYAVNRQERELDIVILSSEDGAVVSNLTGGSNQDLGFESIQLPGARWNAVPWMSWSGSDDRLAYFVRKSTYRSLMLQNVVTRAVEDLIDLEMVDAPESPDFSPDERTVAFSARQGAIGDIYLLDLTTRELTNLTNDAAADYAPTFSPDGAFLVYLARVGGHNKLFTLDLATRAKTQLTFGTFSETAAQFVDDHTLVFSSTATDPLAPVDPAVAADGAIFNVWSLDLSNGSSRQITDAATGNVSTIVLPGQDDTHIGFVTYFAGEYGVHKIPRDTPGPGTPFDREPGFP